MTSSLLITPDELHARLRDTCVLDASWIYPPFNPAGIDVCARYAGAHIEGAWFLDLRALSDPRALFDPRVEAVAPPAPGVLEATLPALGITTAHPIVVTDMDGGCTTAPFARHILIDAGFTDVRLLDGGTPAWSAAGHPLRGAEPKVIDRPCPDAVQGPRESVVLARFAEVEAAARGDLGTLLIDARAGPGNAGVLPDDYCGLEVPCAAALSPLRVIEEVGAGQRFRREDDLKALFDAVPVPMQPVKITTCYFGLGASVVATALEIAGRGAVRVFAGSLLEWAARRGGRGTTT